MRGQVADECFYRTEATVLSGAKVNSANSLLLQKMRNL